MRSDGLDARFLSDGTLAAIRDFFDLEAFLDAAADQRAVYYRFIGDQRSTFAAAGCAPDDSTLREIVVMMLRHDRSYRVYLLNAGASSADDLQVPERWDNLLRAGAGAILCRYVRDIGE
jgi:hypothetical protein